MKISIFYKFKDGPWGGGNQFLKSLKSAFFKAVVYEENFKKANIILFNSHQDVADIIKTKRKFPQKFFIHRVDGPIYEIRKKDCQGQIEMSYFEPNRNVLLGEIN